MNSTGRHGEKSGYLVILLLVVGLAAFSHSVKQLTEIHHLTLDAGRLITQLAGNATPVEIPHTVVKIEKLASCKSKQSAPSLELPWLDETPSATEPSAVAPRHLRRIRKIERRVIVGRTEAEIARLKNLPSFEIDGDAFEVRIPAEVQNLESDDPIAVELPLNTFKPRSRKHGIMRINPRDREMILKTLNRSINLRIAG